MTHLLVHLRETSFLSKMTEHITEQTLFLFFDGRATSLQRKLIEDWLQDTANEELYFAALEAWERQHPQLSGDTGDAQDRFFSYLREPSRNTNPALPQQVQHNASWFWWQRGLMAASVTIALLAGLGFLFRDTIRYQHFATDFGETRSIQLADGSRVTLNANSELKVLRWSDENDNREVWLTGEAEFVVTHTKDHRRFIVRTRDNLSVDVLGTVFSVNDRGSKATVALLKGKVNVRYTEAGFGQKQIILKPGNVVTVNEKGNVALTSQTDPEVFSSWKKGQFVFNNSSLLEIMQLIKDNYGVTVRLTDPALSQKRVSGTFTAQSAQELLSVLAQMYSLKLEPDNDNFILISPHSTPI